MSRYLSTPLFGEIDAEMNEAELELSKSTPSAGSTSSPERWGVEDSKGSEQRSEISIRQAPGFREADLALKALSGTGRLQTKSKTYKRGMATITRKQVTLAALALAVTLKATLGFAGGVVRAGLRGAEPSAGKAASAQPSAFEGLLPAAGALAVGASAIALRRSSASSSKGWSPVALRATRVEWFRKVRRISGDRAVFDVTVKKPMGLVLEYLPDKKGDRVWV
ncbi:unnamed protein product [Effrenium voratum]|nr:unnamed protein product [Effrenium voratum]